MKLTTWGKHTACLVGPARRIGCIWSANKIKVLTTLPPGTMDTELAPLLPGRTVSPSVPRNSIFLKSPLWLNAQGLRFPMTLRMRTPNESLSTSPATCLWFPMQKFGTRLSRSSMTPTDSHYCTMKWSPRIGLWENRQYRQWTLMTWIWESWILEPWILTKIFIVSSSIRLCRWSFCRKL